MNSSAFSVAISSETEEVAELTTPNRTPYWKKE